ncbi:MAG: type I-E CRISPR-associated protein Cas7/Cse4/CasC [Anaerolineae bacterium]|nr:type I-E CRISPR-associated protein Cas7/Cse4/CasC [Anaerolineae bacterium]
MFIELHIIQNFAPANLNRDDTGSPKECQFGGVRRARISSQSFKRAIRFEPAFAAKTEVSNGHRTKRMALPIEERLVKQEKSEEESKVVALAFAKAYAGKMDKGEKTNVLVYLSDEELDWIATSLLAQWDTAIGEATGKSKQKIIGDLVKELVKETKERTNAPDVALFGRMLANDPKTNIDAACQVAHALSTHPAAMEWDYYTAIDDLQPEDTTGADMIGYTGYNSSCFYRYARLDWTQLKKNLGWRDESSTKKAGEKELIRQRNQAAIGLARRTVEGFLRAALEAIPTGKQNAFAAQNPTNMALAVVREDGRSWNLSNAFEVPVQARNKMGDYVGYITPSIQELENEWADKLSFYDDAQAKIKAIAVYTDRRHQEALDILKPHLKATLSAWVGEVTTALPQE